MNTLKNIFKIFNYLYSSKLLDSQSWWEPIPEEGWRAKIYPWIWSHQLIGMEEPTEEVFSLPNWKVIYNNQAYEMIPLSEEYALNIPWSTKENMSSWAMKISWHKIWYYNIPEKFLKYTVVQESLCPDMVNWFSIDSIKEELNIIPENIYNEYLKWRISFFKNMKNYWEWLSESDLENLEINKEYQNKSSTNFWKVASFLVSEWIKIQNKETEKINTILENKKLECANLSIYDYLRKELWNNIENIYYPYCWTDIWPSVNFPDKNITYLDNDNLSVISLQNNWYNTIQSTAEEHSKKYDLTILLNAPLPEHVLSNNIKEWWFLLFNENWTNAVEWTDSFKQKMLDNTNFKLIK